MKAFALAVMTLVALLPPSTAVGQGTIGPCIDCAVKRPCFMCPRAAACCTGSECDNLRKVGWTILDYNMVWCRIYTPNTEEEDCRGERCVDSPPLDPSDGPVIQTCSPDCGSPIVIDLDCGGFSFTDAQNGVLFDIDGDRAKEKISWLDPSGGEVFLALDRNGNGFIDDGRELFGNWTAQPATSEPNGFKALAVFDSPDEGGNADGILSGEDRVFGELLLWKYSNHDGVSQSDELSSLLTSRVRGIDLTYVESNRRDRNGNYLRWAGKVYFETQRRMAAVDVIFLMAE